MRRFILPTLAALAALTTACIREADRGRYSDDDYYEEGSDHESNSDNSISCAPAPSGAGYWEDEGDDGLHCNYLWDGTDDWAYTLNSSETACKKMSWAPYQQDGGYLKMWSWDGNKGCDWVIPW